MKNSKTGKTMALMMPVVLGLGACVGPLKKDTQITVISNPDRATVLANGVEVGKTPLRMSPGQVFSSGFVGSRYQYKGTLTIRKFGCETHSVQVNDALLSKDIAVNLKCDPSAVQTPAVDRPPQPAAPMETSKTTAARLRNLEQLRQQGLVTEQEYQAIRNRILSEL